MSIGDNYNSPYTQYLRDRRKINYVPWGGTENENKKYCISCYSSGLGRLIPSQTEKHILYCRNCGKSYSMDEVSPTTKSTKKRFTTTKQPPLIISRWEKKKRKKPGELTEEDRRDLGSAEGATLIDSRDTYTDSQGGRY